MREYKWGQEFEIAMMRAALKAGRCSLVDAEKFHYRLLDMYAKRMKGTNQQTERGTLTHLKVSETGVVTGKDRLLADLRVVIREFGEFIQRELEKSEAQVATPPQAAD